MELFDLYDRCGKRLNKTAERSDVHSKGLWHRSVHVWIISSGKVLLQKRSNNKESYPGMWDISAAGHISAGEDALSTAVREVKEELGVDIGKSDLKFLFTVSVQAVLNNYTFFDNEINDVFLVDLSSSEKVGLRSFQINDEVDGIRWVSFSDFADMVKASSELVPHPEEYKKLLRTNLFSL